MGLFSRRPDFYFDQVVSTEDLIYDAFTDDDGVVWLDGYEEGTEIDISGVVIDGYIYPAFTDEYGRIFLDEDDD